MYDKNFQISYPQNVKKVNKAIEEISGKHAIDETLAESFIESQLSPMKRQSARDLIENTHYITLKEVEEVIGTLIDKLYLDFKDTSKKIYIVSGNIKKSSYFLSVLACKHIKAKKLREPFGFIESLTDSIIKEVGDSPLIFIDDAAYSGSQLAGQLSNIYYGTVIENKNPAPNIYVLLVALNTMSLKLLSKVPSKKGKVFSKMSVLEHVPSPFKLLYLEKHLYQPLPLVLGLERFLQLTFFFSYFTMNGVLPYLSLYFDHKLADPVSTFTNALMYGPIVPNNLRELADDDDGFEIEYASDISVDSELKEDLLEQYYDKNKGKSKTFFKSVCHEILSVINQDNQNNDKEGVAYLQFKPFINTCNTSQSLLKLVNDEEIRQVDYRLFMLPEGCLRKGDKNCGIAGNDLIRKGIIFNMDIDTFKKKDFEQKVEEVYDIHARICSFRCPETWYKSGMLEMKHVHFTPKKRSKTKSVSRSMKTRRRKTLG